MEDKQNVLKEEKPFAYKFTKDGKCFIYWNNKQIMIVDKEKANKLRIKMDSLDEYGKQLILAKTTGHFKHGNERN